MKDPYNYQRYIIYASEDVPFIIRARDIALTIAAWTIYVYFIRASWPFFIDLVTWVANGFNDLINYANLSIVPTIEDYGVVAVGITFTYVGWALYNLLRFRGRQRRKPRAIVAPEDLANMYGFSAATVNEWQDASSMVMHHDAQGLLTEVKITR
jgi:biofilm PGA synthesis protein PgaD